MNTTACVHLGAYTGEVLPCNTCHGNVRVKLYECKLHGDCTLRKRLSGIRCCSECEDRTTGNGSEQECAGPMLLPR